MVDLFPRATYFGAQRVDDEHERHSLAGSWDECLPSGERTAKREEIEGWLATGLAVIAGFLDAYGYITYETYISFMSGNTTRAGNEIGQGNIGQVVNAALAIVFFVGGSFAGALLAYSSVRQIRRLVWWQLPSG